MTDCFLPLDRLVRPGDRPMTDRSQTDSSDVSLLVDVGSAWTKACVIGRTRGRWRIVGQVAQPSAWGDAELRLALAARLGPGIDRRLRASIHSILESAPRIECHTPRRAGRIALVAVSREVSGAAARRAAQSAGWVVVEEATADDGRPLAERLAALQAAQVDAWLVAGGFDTASSRQAVEAAALAAAGRAGADTPVIWAGSAALAGEVAGLFPDGTLQAVANPRPSPDVEDPLPLRHRLEELLQRAVAPRGVTRLAPISFRRAVAELARASNLRIVGVDLGARYATWVTADESGGAESRVYAAGGLASPFLTEPGGPMRVTRLLPHAIDELAVADTLQNIQARPGTLPQTEDELVVTHAAAKVLLAEIAGHERLRSGTDLIIGAGRAIAGAPNPAHAAQILLDGMRPVGVTQLALDPSGALGPLGSLDDDEIPEGIAILRDDLLVPLGASVVTRGGRPGQTAMRVTVHRAGWPEIGPFEVRAGQLRTVPLPRGQVAELQIELENGATLGIPRRSRRARAQVSGGVVGLVLDARDAPLNLPRRLEDRRALLAAWRDGFVREPSADGGAA